VDRWTGARRGPVVMPAVSARTVHANETVPLAASRPGQVPAYRQRSRGSVEFHRFSSVMVEPGAARTANSRREPRR
jgi:hypothetical protein